MESLTANLPPGLAGAAANIPGYTIISQLILKAFGIDVGDIISFYLVLFGVYQGARILYNKGRACFYDLGTSTVLIDDDDTLYYQFIKWISAQRKVETYRELQATTKSSRSFDDEYDSDDDFSDVLDDAGLFSYEKWAGSTPLSYEPTLTDDSFVYNGQHFYYEKQTIENKYQQQDDSHVIIRCMGRSTQPIKDFLGHVKDWSSKRVNNTTDIYRSRYGGRYEGARWERQATRPARPVSTVSLDEAQKTQVVADINEYLHPATAKWYAARGIPHRRGYLFHGPPGTGKTSLSFALAGMFGLSIYCASLSETELKESDLASLFTHLPSRCIVLLEDIDSAGIRREKGSGDSDTDNDDDSDSESDEPVEKRNKSNLLQYFLPQIVAKWIANPTGDNTNAVLKALAEKTAEFDDKGGKSNISLAGLLNIIDGAASHEGRVLIMTTNYPEKLDSALIRPGRVDLQIKFTLAMREQISEIFRRMYSTDGTVKSRINPQAPDSKALTVARGDTHNTCKTCSHNHAPNTGASTAVELRQERIAEMADQFAALLSDTTFSPAEIQGYLLLKKKDPAAALAGVKEWGEKVLEAKKQGKKVVDMN